MGEKGVYLPEADVTRGIYIKEEPTLGEVGHFHEGVEIVAFLEGKAQTFLIKQSQEMLEGEIFFADSFECHHYKQLSPTIKAIVIVLSSEYTNVFKSLYHGKSFPAFMTDKEKNKEIINLMKTWLNETEKNYMLNVGYANLLFSKLIKNYGLEEKKQAKDKNISLKLLKYVNEHYSEDISLALVAKEIGYTKEYCSKIFTEAVGMNFRDYLNYLRIKKAEELLALKKTTKQTTTEIIYKCGFNSTATFYRAKKSKISKNIK